MCKAMSWVVAVVLESGRLWFAPVRVHAHAVPQRQLAPPCEPEPTSLAVVSRQLRRGWRLRDSWRCQRAPPVLTVFLDGARSRRPPLLLGGQRPHSARRDVHGRFRGRRQGPTPSFLWKRPTGLRADREARRKRNPLGKGIAAGAHPTQARASSCRRVRGCACACAWRAPCSLSRSGSRSWVAVASAAVS